MKKVMSHCCNKNRIVILDAKKMFEVEIISPYSHPGNSGQSQRFSETGRCLHCQLLLVRKDTINMMQINRLIKLQNANID